MFARYVYEKSSAEYKNHIILTDSDDLLKCTDTCTYFISQGFQVIEYMDDLHFRAEHEDALNDADGKYLLVLKPGNYVPYDIVRRFGCFDISFQMLFPKLNTSTVKEILHLNLDLLCMAYIENFSDLRSAQATQQFIEHMVYGQANVEKYLKALVIELESEISSAKVYKDWFRIANLKATIDTISTEYDAGISVEYIHQLFIDFILTDFAKLSSTIDRDGPVFVSRAMEYMHDHSKKFVIIVMDGMSEFDWLIISKSFAGLKYEKTDAFAMIPTTTSISRQCLLSNKYPSQLAEPWKQSKEKAEFVTCAKSLGYADNQIAYTRGYDVDFGSFIKCGAVIINDVDDMVHGQKQGRIGMFNDITVMAKQAQLVGLTKQLLRSGFDVYITADHGNTPCVGMGKLMKTGVEVETKSRRMVVLRDFADRQALIGQYDLIQYPKYFLSKEYDYLICGAGFSFDAKDEAVMSHGGITVDEVVVPFIKIKADENNG